MRVGVVRMNELRSTLINTPISSSNGSQSQERTEKGSVQSEKFSTELAAEAGKRNEKYGVMSEEPMSSTQSESLNTESTRKKVEIHSNDLTSEQHSEIVYPDSNTILHDRAERRNAAYLFSEHEQARVDDASGNLNEDLLKRNSQNVGEIDFQYTERHSGVLTETGKTLGYEAAKPVSHSSQSNSLYESLQPITTSNPVTLDSREAYREAGYSRAAYRPQTSSGSGVLNETVQESKAVSTSKRGHAELVDSLGADNKDTAISATNSSLTEETIDLGVGTVQDERVTFGSVAERVRASDPAVRLQGAESIRDSSPPARVTNGPATPTLIDAADHIDPAKEYVNEGELPAGSVNQKENLLTLSLGSQLNEVAINTRIGDSEGVQSVFGSANVMEPQRRDSALGTGPTIPVTPIGLSENNSHRALGDGIVWMVRNSRGEAHFAVNPPDLGPINVSMTTRDEEVFVKISVNDEATRNIIETGVVRLRDSLSSNGLTLGEFEVSRDADGFGDMKRHGREVSDSDEAVTEDYHSEGKDEQGNRPDLPSGDDSLVDYYV